MPLVLRKLKTKDIFPMSRIIKKIGIKEIMKQAAAALDKKSTGEKINTEDKQMQAGIEMLAVILENIYLAESEVNAFLADLVGLKPEQFAELDIEELTSVFDQLRNMTGLSGFLKLASQ